MKHEPKKRTKLMKIKEIKSQSRRDFTAVYGCEHCGAVTTGCGYDDKNFHNNVIPNMKCADCGKISTENYRHLAPKYSEHDVI
jgi:hypothetical protein